ncbi:MAG: adenosylcobinamide-phosphate synthase CbiB [Nitrospirota bacterium]|nr:adenosylcobinamide-phosphate synthase CbiB [Nitrospirota bacterium]
MFSDPPGSLPIALVSLVLDVVFGERGAFLHPVPLMGKTISMLEQGIRKAISPSRFRHAGILLPVVLSSLFGGGAFLILRGVRLLMGPTAEIILEVFWGYQLLAGRSLYDHVESVEGALASGDLERSRSALSRIVGRDTKGLSEEGVSRGALESLSENANDALVAPLFFMLLGGVPFVMIYKAISTLDSMVGYKNERYLDLGWASARCDDILAYLPARITFFLLMIFLLPFRPGKEGQTKIPGPTSVVARGLRSRRSHPSPNSGYPMAAFAALLDVRLGGGAFYFGRWTEKPVIGSGHDPGREDLLMGLRLYRMFVFSLIMLLAGLTFMKMDLHV